MKNHRRIFGSLLVGRQLTLPLERRTAIIAVDIEDNLSNAISQAGEGDALSALLFDGIFGAVIDFQLENWMARKVNVYTECRHCLKRLVLSLGSSMMSVLKFG